jgi:dTDP-4-amino-4,6-dideoxygalactose transaminase
MKWVNKKKVNYDRLEELLSESENLNQFSNDGPMIKKLESRLHELLKLDDNKTIILTNSGTSALHAIASVLKYITSRDLTFVTQAFTFPASCQGSLSNSKIVDIDTNNMYGPDLLDINPDDIDGVIVTNIFGYICNIRYYIDWCNEHNKYLIFDNAATPYSFIDNKNILNYGTASIISFHHTKPIGFGEGGAIIIDNKYRDLVWSICNFGKNIDKNINWDRSSSNYKMSDISAGFIYMLLDDFNHIVNHHQKMYKYYYNKIKDKDQIYPTLDQNIFVSSLIYICKNKDISKKIMDDMKTNNIECKKYYSPLIDYHVSSSLYSKIICIPCNIDMNYQDIDLVVDIIEKND